MTSSASPAPPLLITVRFSTSQPDLDIDIASPQTTTVLAFKHNLRNRLSSRNRLRLIYQGRILIDASALSAALKPLPAPPPPSSPAKDDDDPKGKGKGKAADLPIPIKVYLNCSIGDELSATELAEEQAAAEKPPETNAANDSAAAAAAAAAARQRPRPRGFDRLLQAGFSQSEIATLRTQFASIHTERFAPDATPSPDTLRGMEDSWIDSNAGELPSSSSNSFPLEDDFSSMSTVLDVLIRGMMIGFFFPLGSMTWLLRQGIWGEKWQVFVGSGVVLSLTVGVFMSLSVER